MEITLNELNAIAQTLPIGLYAKRRVSMSVESGEETSYYIPTEDKIVISYEQVATTLKNFGDIADENDRENIVRGNLYHELSHAILTPKIMRVSDIINIFEDERIETLLRGYYLNVDFKKMVKIMNGYVKGTPPTNAMQAFYYCVRFRDYKDEFVQRVDEIIIKYKKLNRFTGVYYDKSYSSSAYDVWNYVAEIERLYEDIAKDFSSTGGSSSSDSANGYSTDIKGGSASESADKDSMETKDGIGCPTDDMLGDDEMGTLLSSDEMGIIIGSAFNGFVDSSLENALKVILDNFKKKNSKGSAINSYSGVFNPRNCVRDDYKYFEKALSTQGNNSFGTFHLNLFIDVSGSFCCNEQTVNTLINALSSIERQNKNFSMDLVLCSLGEELVTDKTKRFIKCQGGNWLDDNIYSIFRKLQKPNTFNYNIVLFDGDAYSDTWYPHRYGACSTKGKTMSAFDKNNCTIITDWDNEKYIKTNVHTAKVIYTRNYTDELIKNVQTVLASAFR